MRDFKAFVQQHVAALALPAGRERKVVEEWAAQLEDLYEQLRADGRSDEEAWRELQRQVPDWNALGRELLDAEPVLLRMANADRGPLASRAGRAVVTAIREKLTAGLVHDLHSGVRLLIKDRGFSAAVILTLAICLGANAAVFTVVHAVLLRPLPVPESERIVGIGDVYPTITPNDILSNDAPSYFDRLEAVTALEEQAMFTFWFDTTNSGGVPEELRGMRATPSLFRLLRVPPALGRTFTDAEGEIGAEHKVILSHGLWQRLYGGDPTVIGRTLRLGWTGQGYTIVGVMPRGFRFFDKGYDGHAGTPGQEVQFWIPLAFTSAQKSDSGRTRYGFFHIGRLRPEATVDQVRAQIDALNAANVTRFPQFRFAELGMYTAVTPLQEALTRDIRRTLHLLWGGAGFVLLIGAINIANLALARASARAREFATRLALGAGRFQLTRQLIVEAMVPAAIGGAAGVAVGAGILQGLALTGLNDLPSATEIRIDGTVTGLIAAVSALVGLLIGLVPVTTTRTATINHVLVDDRLAARLWPDVDPIGKSIFRGDSGPFTVVGVVREVRFESLAARAESIGTAYFPNTQAPPLRRLRWIAIKTASDSAAVMRAVRSALVELDPDLPLSDIQTMSERTSKSIVSQSLAMTLATMFGFVALLLSLLGIYGVLANVVARRAREFGIRMALGSTARGVFHLVLREGMASIGIGLILGLAGAVAMGRALEGHVFGVEPTDPFILGGVVVATGCVALLACLGPARRATRVDPVEVLSES